MSVTESSHDSINSDTYLDAKEMELCLGSRYL
jgi:hypothetical protein